MSGRQSRREGSREASELLHEISLIARKGRTSRILDFWIDPELVFLELFAKHDRIAWLDAGFGAERGQSRLCAPGEDGFTLIGNPSRGTVTVEHPASGRSGAFAGSIFDAIESVEPGAPSESHLPDEVFDLGWVGWFGYESGAVALGVPHAAEAADSAVIFVDQMISFDMSTNEIELRCIDTDAGSSWLETMTTKLMRLQGCDVPEPSPVPSGVPRALLRHNPDEYLDLIERCQHQIANGEAYQICLTNQIRVPSTDHPAEVFRRLRRLNPTPRGGYIRVGDIAIASSSPEEFLRITRQGEVETRPIKGTRPRGSTRRSDAFQRRELLASDKERAENVMIVDLMRNDLSRVARVGSVQVSKLFEVETYANVFQLVSTVTANLGSGVTRSAVLRATFPAGSMTGAPKFSAMRILHQLEGGARGPYAGTFGFFELKGRAELSMTIRTIVFDVSQSEASIGVGGGITALSIPSEEVQEMILKAQPMLSALGASLGDAGPSAAAEPNAEEAGRIHSSAFCRRTAQ